MRILKFIIFVTLALLFGVFGAHNSTMVSVNFYPFGLEISIAAFLIFFASILIGAILGGLVYSTKILHWRKLLRQKNKQIEKLEKDLAAARAENLNSSLPANI